MNNRKGKLHETRRIKGEIQTENVCGEPGIKRDVRQKSCCCVGQQQLLHGIVLSQSSVHSGRMIV